MTQEEFNRRQEHAQEYLDDARRKLEVAYSTISDAQEYLDDVEGELDYMKDFEGKEEKEPNCIFESETDIPINVYHDLTMKLLKEILKLHNCSAYTITLKMFVE